MKKFNSKTIFCFLTIIVSLTFYSCQKEKSLYSCDPAIELWVKKSLPVINKMQSSDILKLDPSIQVPVFRAFSSDQRLGVWLNRIDQILLLGWTEKERLHLIDLRKSLTAERFSDEVVRDTEKFQKIKNYEKEWVNYGINELGWTKAMIGNMFARIDTPNEKINNLKNGNLNPSIVDPHECKCSTYDDYCPVLGSCISGGCIITSWGCGLLFGYMCNGNCSLF